MSFSDSDQFGDHGGCALSVLISTAVTAVVAGVFGASASSGAAFFAFAIAFIVALLVITVSAIVIGLPLTRLLESNGWEEPWSYPLAGFVFGAAIFFVLLEALDLPGPWTPDGAPTLLIGALPGCLCGALWWWFERRHRQGNDRGEG